MLDESCIQHNVRLDKIDAPEKDQAYGEASKKHLSECVFGKDVKVFWENKDRHGQILGVVSQDSRNVNLQMVKDGFAWHFKFYDETPSYAEAEKDARLKRLGLWDDDTPIEPYEFRKARGQRREEDKADARPYVDKYGLRPMEYLTKEAYADAFADRYIAADFGQMKNHRRTKVQDEAGRLLVAGMMSSAKSLWCKLRGQKYVNDMKSFNMCGDRASEILDRLFCAKRDEYGIDVKSYGEDADEFVYLVERLKSFQARNPVSTDEERIAGYAKMRIDQANGVILWRKIHKEQYLSFEKADKIVSEYFKSLE